MNYLGHLFLSGDDTALMVANLYGDFYKGRIHADLDPIVKKGILLHRRIDSFMDRHPVVSVLAHSLSEELPKVSSIAIDIYFDHLLAANWGAFHQVPYKQFLEKFYASLPGNSEYPLPYREFCDRLVKYRWLDHYPLEDSVDKMCVGVNSRLSFQSSLVRGIDVFRKHKHRIVEAFFEYMPDAIEHFGIAERGQML